MKRKIFFVFILILSLCFVFSACSQSAEYYEPSPSYNNKGAYVDDSSSSQEVDPETPSLDSGTEQTPQRKIIYSATVVMADKDLNGRIALIRSCLNGDEWFDSESIESDYAYLVVRVKSNRLDKFLADISAGAEVGRLQKEATDISLSYQSKEDRMTALNEEKDLLTTYLEAGTITPDYAITRIAEINTEIKRINGELRNYDSLIEYSTVTIRLSKTYVPEADPTYGDRASETLSDTWIALGDFFRFLGLAVIAIFPWLLVIVPVALIVVFSILFAKRKGPFKNRPIKSKKQNKEAPEQTEEEKGE